ncbi:Hypothetical protein AJAP_22500 [Amycolatopsis japonica]|uniref:Uncharacterized protein n=1 Tax=Amycolatopsis japonica TaxID=208439 RepID=A0A075V3D3_9PSEU|nr:hypothetical protein [Amycolatopsis japonica]AIG77355.1 Hypothetical protein AJAP_22500 [Amycolatopsis japonica]
MPVELTVVIDRESRVTEFSIGISYKSCLGCKVIRALQLKEQQLLTNLCPVLEVPLFDVPDLVAVNLEVSDFPHTVPDVQSEQV